MVFQRCASGLLQPGYGAIEIEPADDNAALRIGVFVLTGKHQEAGGLAHLEQPGLAVEFLFRSSRTGFGGRDALARRFESLHG